MDALRIEYVPLADLTPAALNPKGHDLARIKRSLRDFGFVSPAIRDERTGRLVAGHGRREALQEMHAAGEPAPDRIEVAPDGTWSVPVIVGVQFENAAAADAYLLADNRLVELGAWDDRALVEVLRAIEDAGGDISQAGFEPDDIDRLLEGLREPEPEPSAVDPGTVDFGEPPPLPVTVPGDLWLLGEHRVLCGDATIPEDMARLVDGAVAAVVTDPPYAIYGSATGVSSDITDDRIVRPFFERIMRLCAEHLPWFGHAYVFCDWRSWPAIWDSAKRGGMVAKNLLVWDKGGQGLGSNYANTYELIGFFAKLPKQKAMGDRPTGQRVVHRPNLLRQGRVLGAERLHNAAKPVPLLEELIRNSTDSGGVVLDPFAGSGSTLIAADRLGRAAYCMEVDPGWTDVTVRRWERTTGQRAQTTDGKTLPELDAPA